MQRQESRYAVVEFTKQDSMPLVTISDHQGRPFTSIAAARAWAEKHCGPQEFDDWSWDIADVYGGGSAYEEHAVVKRAHPDTMIGRS